MKKKFFLFTVFLLISFFAVSVLADDLTMKLISYEEEIVNSATRDLTYKKGMVIDSEVLDPLVKQAVSTANNCSDVEVNSYKKLERNVLLNLKGCYGDVKLKVGSDVCGYADIIDNVVINANGIYFFVQPSDLKNAGCSENIELSVKDENGIVAQYNGTALTRKVGIALPVLFVFVALYLFGLSVFVKNGSFSDSVNKKSMYIIVLSMASFSLMIAGISHFVDWGAFAEKKFVKLDKTNNLYFNVEVSGVSSSSGLCGVSMGLPMYSEEFKVDSLCAFLCSKDGMSGDVALGGSYNDAFDVFKFPIKQAGKCYIKNNNVTFSDINSNEPVLHEAVAVLSARGILNGKSDNFFGAEEAVTRAETVTMICRMIDLPHSTSGGERFADVDSNNWYQVYAMTAKENNILSGYEDNTFRGSNTITRQEFVTILGQIMVNKMGYVLGDDSSYINKYNDYMNIAPWASQYVELMEKTKISIWDEYYLPKQPITRGEAAVLLYRVYLMYN